MKLLGEGDREMLRFAWDNKLTFFLAGIALTFLSHTCARALTDARQIRAETAQQVRDEIERLEAADPNAAAHDTEQ